MKKLLTVLLLLMGLTLLAAQVSVKSSVNKQTLYLSDTLLHTLRITTQTNQNIPAPPPPQVDGLRLINQSSSSESRVSIVNMQYERSYVVNYLSYYKPTRTGRITIPASKITVGNIVYQSQAITIEVKADAGYSAPSDPFPPYDEPYQEVGESFVIPIAEKQSIYRGEPVIVAYYLYTTEDVRSLNLTEEKDFEGYGKALYEQPSSLDFERVSYQQKSYKRSLLKKMVLYPHLAKEIQAPQLIGSIRLMQYGYQNRGFRSKDAFIHVKELPAGAPKGYSGAVGNFNLSQRLSSQNIKMGEAAVFTIQINGFGNFNQFTAPKLESTPALQISAAKIKDQLTSSIKGVRLLQYTIIPKAKGEIKIPSFVFSWLDSNTGKYMSFRSQEQILSVKAGSTTSSNSINKGTNELQMQELSGNTEYKDHPGIQLDWWFWLLSSLMLFSLIPSLYLAHRKKQREKNPKKYLDKQLQAKLKIELQKATVAAQKKDAQFYQIAQNSLESYLCTKYELSAHLRLAEIIDQLKDQPLDSKLIEEISAFFSMVQAARFAPTSTEEDLYSEHLLSFQRIVNLLEKR